jgi:hypothetical protein
MVLVLVPAAAAAAAAAVLLVPAAPLALPWHWQWQKRINKRPAHHKGCISARKLDGMGGRRLGIGLAVVLQSKLPASYWPPRTKSPLGWMPISSRMGSAATLDITDGRGHWTPHLPEQS